MKTVSEVCSEIENAENVEQVVATWKEVVANASHYSLPELARILDSVASLTDQKESSSEDQDTDLRV